MPESASRNDLIPRDMHGKFVLKEPKAQTAKVSGKKSASAPVTWGLAKEKAEVKSPEDDAAA